MKAYLMTGYGAAGDVVTTTVPSDQSREVCMSRIIDVWMQHPTERHSADPMFASLRRWTAKTPRPPVITPEMTIAARKKA